MYKEIAGIITREYCPTIESAITRENISKKLADYFEREDKIKMVTSLTSGRMLKTQKKPEEQIFNRKKFLRSCGVN